jgi:cell division protein FtsB
MAAQRAQAYRYGPTARRRAVLLLVASVLAFIVLLIFLGQQWATLRVATRIFVGVLALLLVGAARAQAARLRFRCRFLAEHVELSALFGRRTLRWDDVAEVRRLVLRQVGGERRWACTLYVRTPRGTRLPVYLFDDQLDQAEDAFWEVIRCTPHAVHKGLQARDIG